MKYLIDIPEIWIRSIEVVAETEQQALEKASTEIEKGDEGYELNFSHTMPEENWHVQSIS